MFTVCGTPPAYIIVFIESNYLPEVAARSQSCCTCKCQVEWAVPVQKIGPIKQELQMCNPNGDFSSVTSLSQIFSVCSASSVNVQFVHRPVQIKTPHLKTYVEENFIFPFCKGKGFLSEVMFLCHYWKVYAMQQVHKGMYSYLLKIFSALQAGRFHTHTSCVKFFQGCTARPHEVLLQLVGTIHFYLPLQTF